MNRTLLRRRYAVSVLIVVLVSALSRTVLAAGFPDTVHTDYATAFAYLQEEGVVNGYSDGFARPDFPLNRVEALKVILKAQGQYDNRIAYYTKKTPPIPLFSDVQQSQWYAPYLETAFEYGVVTGYPDGTFRPAKLLSVEEAVTMLMRTFGEQGDATEASLSNFIQNTPNQWYTPSINAAVDRNLIMNKGRLQLGSAISRGQFFDMVYRLHYVKTNGLVAYDGSEPTLQVAQIVAAPVQRTVPTEVYSETGVTTHQGTGVPSISSVASSLPQNVSVAPKIDHPHASEKYFAISMPSIGINDLVISHPEDAVSKEGVLSVLDRGVGHLFAYPGGGGKIMVYGHSSGYPWDVSEFTKIFRRINELAAGDRVYITYAGNLHIYEVSHEQTILASKAGDAFKDDGSGEELILFTCWPPDSISQRYLVHAVPVETVALR